MIVQCDNCQARFRIKDEKISDKGAKVKCSKCKNYFIVRKDRPAPAITPQPLAEAPAPAPAPSADDGGFGIDFEPEAPQAEAPAPPPVAEAPAPPPVVEAPAPPPVVEAPAPPPVVEAPAPPPVVEAPAPPPVVEAPAPPPVVEAPAAPPVVEAPQITGNESPSFGDDTADADDGGWSMPESSAPVMVDNEADDSWGSSPESEAPTFGGGAEEDSSETGGFGGFGFEEETAVGSDTTSETDDGPAFGGFGGGGGGDFEVEVDGDNSSGDDETVIFSVGGAGSEDSGMGLATSLGSDDAAGEETVFGGFGMADDEEAETQVSDTAEEEESESEEEEGGKKKKKKEKKKKEKKEKPSGEGGGGRSKRLIAVLIILVVIGGGAYAYTQGMLDPAVSYVKSMLGSSAPDEGAIEIIELKGRFVENESMGTIYALEGKIKNHTEDNQRILVVKGTIYDNNGEAIKSKKVSPGRIVSIEQLKTFSKDDFNRHFKKASAGNISPLGEMPVMIVFMDVSPNITEAGIEVVR